jgi:CdiI immunity protein
MRKPKLTSKNGKPPAPSPAGATPVDYSALRDFMRGYLNQDFADEYGSAAEAAEAFCGDASDEEIREVAEQWKTFVKSTAGQSLDKINKMLAQDLQSGWAVTDAAELEAISKVFTKHLPN